MMPAVRPLVSCLTLVPLLLLTVSCRHDPVETPFTSVPHINSGGLALARSEWDSRFGPPISSSAGSAFYSVAWDGHAAVLFTQVTSHSPQLVEIVDIRLTGHSVSRAEAQRVVERLLPNDTVHIRTSTQHIKRGLSIVTDHLMSESLKSVYGVTCDSRPEFRIQPGETFVSYTLAQSSDRVSRVEVYWNCPQH